jgi:hypothetical protein
MTSGENTIQHRFRQSASRLPEGLVIGSDYSIHPMPGQQALPLLFAGYREAEGILAHNFDAETSER